jgi:uncharacterized protein
LGRMLGQDHWSSPLIVALSPLLIPARERGEIDWDTANRLATENNDFLEYLKLVRQLYQTGEARLADWDVPKEAE